MPKEMAGRLTVLKRLQEPIAAIRYGSYGSAAAHSSFAACSPAILLT